MMTCQQLTTAIASDKLSTLGWRQRLTVKLHLLVCKHCRCYQRQIAAIGESVRSRSCEAPTPCRDLEASLLQKCRDCPPQTDCAD